MDSLVRSMGDHQFHPRSITFSNFLSSLAKFFIVITFSKIKFQRRLFQRIKFIQGLISSSFLRSYAKFKVSYHLLLGHSTATSSKLTFKPQKYYLQNIRILSMEMSAIRPLLYLLDPIF